MPWPDRSARTAPLPLDWPQLRKQVKARAHGQCEQTKADGYRCRAWGTDADHIGEPDDHSLDNLRWLCRYHHNQRTAHQAHQAAAAQRAKLTIPKRRPPGLR